MTERCNCPDCAEERERRTDNRLAALARKTADALIGPCDTIPYDEYMAGVVPIILAALHEAWEKTK